MAFLPRGLAETFVLLNKALEQNRDNVVCLLSKLAPTDEFGQFQKSMSTLKVVVISIEGDTAKIRILAEPKTSEDFAQIMEQLMKNMMEM